MKKNDFSVFVNRPGDSFCFSYSSSSSSQFLPSLGFFHVKILSSNSSLFFNQLKKRWSFGIWVMICLGFVDFLVFFSIFFAQLQRVLQFDLYSCLLSSISVGMMSYSEGRCMRISWIQASCLLLLVWMSTTLLLRGLESLHLYSQNKRLLFKRSSSHLSKFSLMSAYLRSSEGYQEMKRKAYVLVFLKDGLCF